MYIFFFFNDTATTEIYTLSLHDALPIFAMPRASLRSVLLICAFNTACMCRVSTQITGKPASASALNRDRKSTRLNSSHSQISYAVFCLKKKKQTDLLLLPTTYSQATHQS